MKYIFSDEKDLAFLSYVTDKANLIKNVTVTLGKNQKNMPYSEGRAVTLTPGYSDGKKYYKVSADGTVSSTPETNANDLFTVKSGNIFLIWGQDYTVTYTDNKAVGTATMTFTAKPESGYSGSFNKTFKIGAVSLAVPAFVKAEAAGSTGQEPDSLTSGKDDKGNTFYKLNGMVTYTREGAKPSQRICLTLCDGKGNPTAVVLKEGTDKRSRQQRKQKRRTMIS